MRKARHRNRRTRSVSESFMGAATGRARTGSELDTGALAGSLPYHFQMAALWFGFFAMLLMAMVRRHGWEYVPLVIFLGVGRWYTSDLAIIDVADGLSLLSFAGVWLVSAKTES